MPYSCDSLSGTSLYNYRSIFDDALIIMELEASWLPKIRERCYFFTLCRVRRYVLLYCTTSIGCVHVCMCAMQQPKNAPSFFSFLTSKEPDNIPDCIPHQHNGHSKQQAISGEEATHTTARIPPVSAAPSANKQQQSASLHC